MTRGKHVTIPKGITRAVRWIEAQPDVERMVFGQYKPRKRAKSDVDVVGPCNGGLKVVARGEDLAMEMFLHTNDPESLRQRIGERFGEGRMSKLVEIDYTNWKGEWSTRIIEPITIYFGSNQWHQEDQWLLDAVDRRKKVTRTFAMKDIHSWRPL